MWILLKGFESADDQRPTKPLRNLIRANSKYVYEGFITVLARLMFLLYAEARDGMPNEPVYLEKFSLLTLFEKLHNDSIHQPETMTKQFDAWVQILNLFRLVFYGGGTTFPNMPARPVKFFDPQTYPFLEGDYDVRQIST